MGRMSPAILDVAMVRRAAQGRWHHILTALAISVPNHPRKHAPCPTCGGKDRFRFDDRDGNGSWFCNRCDPQAGDGFALIMLVRHCSFPEALGFVAEILGIHPTARASPRLPVPPALKHVDRRALAFKFELAALDLRLRAERIAAAAAQINIVSLNDEELDHALELLDQGHADIARADLFEHVADVVRLQDVLERKKTDASYTRVA